MAFEIQCTHARSLALTHVHRPTIKRAKTQFGHTPHRRHRHRHRIHFTISTHFGRSKMNERRKLFLCGYSPKTTESTVKKRFFFLRMDFSLSRDECVSKSTISIVHCRKSHIELHVCARAVRRSEKNAIFIFVFFIF